MARFSKRVKPAQARADKLRRLDSCESVDARRVKKEMVSVPHTSGKQGLGDAWRDKHKWKGAKGKTKRRHTPKPSK